MSFAAGLILVLVGTAGLLLAPSWNSDMGEIDLLITAIGALLLLYGSFSKSPAAVKKAEERNALRGLIAVVSFAMLTVGMLVVMIYFFGHIDDLRPYVPWAMAGLVLAAAGFYYGIAYQQDTDLVKLAPEIGFVPADTGPGSPDGQYDIKGVAGGLPTLVNLERYPSSRNAPASFSLYILCRTANPYGVELRIKPEGLADKLSGPTLAVPRWDWYSVRANNKELVMKKLPPARQSADSSFSDKYGFLSLEAKGTDFVFNFRREGYFSVDGKEYLLKLLADCSALAASFNQG